MRKKLSLLLGLSIFFIIVPFVNAQVGDQNGIPPTDAIAGFIVNGTTWLGDSYDSTFEIIAGDGISINLNSTDGALMINSTLTQNIAQISYWNYTTPTTITISAVTTDGETNMFLVDPPTHDHAFNSNFDSPSDGRIRYTGELTMNFIINAVVTLSLDGNNNDVVLAIAKNGVVDDHGRIIRSFTSTGQTGATNIQVIEELQQNDYLEIYVGNLDATNDVVINSFDLRVLSPAHGEPGVQYGFLDSIHAIGNVTNTGCGLDEILKVDGTGTFVCSTAGAGGGEANTASNLSPGLGLFTAKSGVDLPFKSLAAGDNIILSQNSTTILINGTGGGSGETNTASNLNVDNATGIFASKVGSDLQFKSLINGSGIIFTENSTNIMINSTSTRDQIHWLNVPLHYQEGALFLGLDGIAYDTPSGSSLDYQTIITKPLYLDYIEFQITANTIATGDYIFRVIDGGAAITSDFNLDIGSASTGDTFRYELDVQVNAGDQVFIDSECTSGVPCTAGQAWYVATMEYYAVDDATYYDGWTFQDDNLGNHTATQALDMDGNSVQNAIWYEVDGTVASVGSIRLGSGDAIGFRNNAGSADNQIGFDSNDAMLINIPTSTTEYQFNSTDFTINTNQIKGTMGCANDDLIDYDSTTGRWECLDPTTLGGSSFFQTMIWNGDPTLTVAKATTTYLGFGSASGAELDVRIPMGNAGTASRLECEVPTSGTNANTQILVRKNSGNTSLVVNYAAGVTGIQTDFVNTFTFNQQDRLDIRVINNSAGGGAANIDVAHCSFLVTYD